MSNLKLCTVATHCSYTVIYSFYANTSQVLNIYSSRSPSDLGETNHLGNDHAVIKDESQWRRQFFNEFQVRTLFWRTLMKFSFRLSITCSTSYVCIDNPLYAC